MTVSLFQLLFYLLLVSLLCGMLCKHVCANNSKELSQSSDNIVTIFKKGGNGKVKKLPDNSKDNEITAKEYYSPVLILAGDIMVALTGVTNNGGDDKSITVLTNYVDTKNKETWKTNVVKSDSWKQISGFQKGITNTDGSTVVKSFLAAANENKIYVLLVYCNKKDDVSTVLTCNFEIVVGTVSGGDGGSQEDKKVLWDELKTLPTPNTYEIKSLTEETVQGKYSIYGSGFLAKEKGIIFVVKVINKDDNIISLFVLSKVNESKPEISQITYIPKKCNQYIFPWNNKILKYTTGCDGGETAKIEESTDKNGEWGNIEKSPFSLANFLNDKKDFITEIIDGKEFIFFTQDVESLPPGGNSNKYLWFSDGTRARNIGAISSKPKCATSNNFFIIEGELFLLIEKCDGDQNKVESISLKHLKEHTEKIKEVLFAWNAEKNKIKQLCKNSVPSKVYCHTDGLVGFLSDTLNKDRKEWKDEYYYKDAIVTKEISLSDGIKFTDKNGAKWSVKNTEKKQQQPYNFIDSGFTLVTTVQVGKVNSEYNSILGIGFAEKKDSIDLLCSNKGMWVMRRGEGEAKIETTKEKCDNGNTYQVALIFDKGTKFKVYINGNYIDNLKTEILQIEKPDDIEYFYFGVDNEQKNDETHVTIQNVLLYNHPFSEDEIDYLKVNREIKPAGAGQGNDEDSTTEQLSGGVGGGGDEGELTPATPTEEVVMSSTQQRESAVKNSVNVNVVMCSVLLILMLCAIMEYSLQF